MSEPSKILIVDDNPSNMELLTAYVEELENVAIDTAGDGEAALEAVRRFEPDVILLDVMMPKMSGFEVCERLKSDPATRDIQVIMVTALNEHADKERGADCGTDEFLSKPVDRITLLMRVKNLLKVRQLKKELDDIKGQDAGDDR